MMRMDVATTSGTYPIVIEPGLLGDGLGRFVRSDLGFSRALVVCDQAILGSHGRVAADSLKQSAVSIEVHAIVANERAKSLATVQQIFRAALDARLDRSSLFIAIGGGITGDVAGFAAATYLRGVPIVQVPTTLLAMVDAAIGGKTGVNFELPSGSLGKNMIGSFWQPAAVLADPQTLSTLPARELRSGLAESIKHAIIADPELFALLEQHIASLTDPMACASPAMAELIHASQRVKVRIVEADEREHGQRALLNLGHTFAHAIETIPQLNLLHGEAVGIGIVAASHAAELTGRMSSDDAARVQQLIERSALPIRLAAPISTAQLMETMRYDKKTVDDCLRLVLPCGIGRAEIADDVPQPVVEAAWQSVGATKEPMT